MKRTIWGLIFCCFAPLTLAFGQGGEKISIAMSPTLLADLSNAQQKFINEEFPSLVKDFAGLTGTLDKAKSPKDVADKVASGESQFGVLQGIEFAELKSADVQALLVAIYREPTHKAILVVKKDAPFKSFEDLKGKNVSLLKQGKEHIHRYVNKEAGGDPAKFFGKVVDASNAEAALDSVLLGKVQGALVDDVSLEIYKEINPGRFRNLKVIGESPPFPPSVIAYNPKKTDAAVVKQFRDGMLKADKSTNGREVLSTFRISAFQPVPSNFEQLLTDIRKAYPSQ